MKRLIIIGSGIGGTIVANSLAKKILSSNAKVSLKIQLFGLSESHIYQPGLLYLPFGRYHEEDICRNQRDLLHESIDFILDEVIEINGCENSITTKSGKVFDYDYLVISTGSTIDVHSIKGMADGADWFYDLEGAKTLRNKLTEFSGGKIVVNVNVPYKCPVGPIEFTLLLYDFLKQKNLTEKTEILYTFPIGRLHGLQPVAEWVEPEFEKRKIKTELFFNTKEIDTDKKIIYSEEGEAIDYDMLVTIPPHTGSSLIEHSGFGLGGWVETDKYSLLKIGSENIFCIGDTTNLPISKAGSTTHYQADAIVKNLLRLSQNKCIENNYDGKVFCFIEAGDGKSTYISFDYENPPIPVTASKLIHLYKIVYNKLYWMAARGIL